MKSLTVLVCLASLAACTNDDEPRISGSRTTDEGSSATSSQSRPAMELRQRPLRLPLLGSDGECPSTTSQHQPDPDLGHVQGSGPPGPVGLSPSGVLHYNAPADFRWAGQAWGGQKVLWAVDGSVRGPVLVRGHQLDGPHEVRFNDPAQPELLIEKWASDATPIGWRDYPSHTRLQAPGCYAYQVDTRAGTTVIVFLAKGPRVHA